MWTCQSRSRLIKRKREKKKKTAEGEWKEAACYGHSTEFEAPPGFKHTHTEDVEAESLRGRFADQLIWKAVKAHVATELQSSLFFILMYRV